jgi:hypothetical protein
MLAMAETLSATTPTPSLYISVLFTTGMAGYTDGRAYAEGFLSGPSAYGLARAPPGDGRRCSNTVSVEVATPRAAVGI